MIDTVVLTLHLSDFRISRAAYGRFSPSAQGFFEKPYIPFGGKAFVKAECNPTKSDKATGLYFPRLTLVKAARKGSIAITLRIEFSAPKILYGNNLDELDQPDLAKICQTLHMRLAHYGVHVGVDLLVSASVSAIHYGKNIPLVDFSLPSVHIRQVAKTNTTLWKDVNESDYRNGGYGIKQHTREWELIIYDKLRDLQQAKKSDSKAYSQDNYTQLDILDRYKPKQPFQVLRIEARYNTPKRIRLLLKSIGQQSTPLVFNQLFSKEIARKVLGFEVESLERQYPILANAAPSTLASLLIDLRINNPTASFSLLMQSIGYHALLQETGTRDIRTIGIENPDDWSKFQHTIRILKLSGIVHSPFQLLRDSIDTFETFKLESYYQNEALPKREPISKPEGDLDFDHSAWARKAGYPPEKVRDV